MGNAGSYRNYPSAAAARTASLVNLRGVCATSQTGTKRASATEIARSSTSIAIRIAAALAIGEHKHYFLTETDPITSAKTARIGNR
jgi:hypothetical protein